MFDSRKFVCLVNETLMDEATSVAELKKKFDTDVNEYFVTLMENLVGLF